MDDLSDALCARFDAITSEAIEARAAIDAAVADARSTLAEGIARRRATRRERDAAETRGFHCLPRPDSDSMNTSICCPTYTGSASVGKL